MEYSKAYLAFKNRTQEIFDFAVLVTLSVPVLKHNVKLYNKKTINRLPEPDYFEPSVVYHVTQDTIESLQGLGVEEIKILALKELLNMPLNNKEFNEKVIHAIGEDLYKEHRIILKKQAPQYIKNIVSCSASYQSKLATYLYFSTFSYFEAYIGDVIRELAESFDKIDKLDYLNRHSLSKELIGDRLKLSKEFQPIKKNRYTKISKQLVSKGYKTPEQIFFSTLLDLLLAKVEDLKANEIPDFLEKYLLYEMTAEEKVTFGTIRGNRNTIGHGSSGFIPRLKDVIDANKFFKVLSSNVDQHIIFHFLKLNNFDHSTI